MHSKQDCSSQGPLILLQQQTFLPFFVPLPVTQKNTSDDKD